MTNHLSLIPDNPIIRKQLVRILAKMIFNHLQKERLGVLSHPHHPAVPNSLPPTDETARPNSS